MRRVDLQVKLLLDSGAFGAWKRGISIGINEYVSFIKRNKDLIHSYVNMDVIPGEKGKQTKSSEALEHSAQLSYNNLQRIKDKGLHPIPVFHQGESFKWLERLIDNREPYIGISPWHRITTYMFPWLDHCFELIAKYQDKKQPIKTHGFGVASPNLLLRYPWTTTDSTNWDLHGAYGHCYIPSLGGKEPDFTQPTSIHFSPRHAPSTPGIVYSTLEIDGTIRQVINKYIKDSLGFSIESTCNSYLIRKELSILYSQGLQKHIRKSRGTDQFDIIFATVVDQAKGSILTKHNANFRLLSYFNLRDTKQDRFEEYMSSGMLNGVARHNTARNWRSKVYTNRRTKYLIDHLEKNSCAE
jgi:hypothetical protein